MTMTDKAYIVANKKQELEVLKKLEKDGLTWERGEQPQEFVPSKKISNYDSDSYVSFPYALIIGEAEFVEGESIIWDYITGLTDEEIVYDGRKE